MKAKKRGIFPITVKPPWAGLILIFAVLLVCIGIVYVGAIAPKSNEETGASASAKVKRFLAIAERNDPGGVYTSTSTAYAKCINTIIPRSRQVHAHVVANSLATGAFSIDIAERVYNSLGCNEILGPLPPPNNKTETTQ